MPSTLTVTTPLLSCTTGPLFLVRNHLISDGTLSLVSQQTHAMQGRSLKAFEPGLLLLSDELRPCFVDVRQLSLC
jgi:hypothetical protein